MNGLSGILNGSEIYEATLPAEHMLKEISKIRDLDKRHEKGIDTVKGNLKKSQVGCLLWLVIICIGCYFFVDYSAVKVGLISIASAIVIQTIIKGRRFRSQISEMEVFEFPDEYYETAYQILDLVSEDIDSDSKIYLKLTMRPTIDDSFLVKEGTIRAYNTWNVSYYDHIWLQMSGRFLDKTKFYLTARTLAQFRQCKAKYKTKYKFKRRIQLRLKPDYLSHPYWKEAIIDARSAVQLPEYFELKKLKADTKGLNLSVYSGSVTETYYEAYEKSDQSFKNITPETIMKMFLSGYQIINLSARLTDARSK